MCLFNANALLGLLAFELLMVAYVLLSIPLVLAWRNDDKDCGPEYRDDGQRPASADRARNECCPKYSNPAFDRAAAEASAPGSNWRAHELPTSHDAMITAPCELADLLLALA